MRQLNSSFALHFSYVCVQSGLIEVQMAGGEDGGWGVMYLQQPKVALPLV